MKFYLGTHHPHWLASPTFECIPLFVSRRALCRYKTLPVAGGRWALDSGGFSELTLHGEWKLSPREYANEVRRYHAMGGMDWAAPQDWMCEPDMLKRTGLSIVEHQRRTVANFLELRSLAPELPIIPVLQGWTEGDYYDCLDMYERAGVDMVAEPLVGLGTVCRRQNTLRASVIITSLIACGLKLHGFGFKSTGLKSAGGRMLTSSDSLAWSYHARREPPLPVCVGAHKNCANCSLFALDWRHDLLESLKREQLALPGAA